MKKINKLFLALIALSIGLVIISNPVKSYKDESSYIAVESLNTSKKIGDGFSNCQLIGAFTEHEFIICDTVYPSPKHLNYKMTRLVTLSNNDSTITENKDSDNNPVIDNPVNDDTNEPTNETTNETNNEKSNNGNHYGDGKGNKDNPDNNPNDDKNSHDGIDTRDEFENNKESRKN